MNYLNEGAIMSLKGIWFCAVFFTIIGLGLCFGAISVHAMETEDISLNNSNAPTKSHTETEPLLESDKPEQQQNERPAEKKVEFKPLEAQKTIRKRVEGRINSHTSAAEVYEQKQLTFIPRVSFDDESDVKNLPIITLHKIDNVLFDDQKVPRMILQCCHPAFLQFLKIMGGAGGMASLCLAAPGFTNGLLGEIFNYEPYGDVSIGVMMASAILMADVAFLQFYDITNKLISKPRSKFISARSSEELRDMDDNNSGVFTIPDSTLMKFTKNALLPACAVGYAGQIVGLWLDIESDFWSFAIPLSAPILLSYAEAYYDMAYRLLKEQALSKTYEETQQRTALLHSLDLVDRALSEDSKDNYILTQSIWKAIAERTNFFGAGDKPSEYTSESYLSAISCLLCRTLAIDDDEELQLHNKIASRLGIEEQPFKPKLFNGIAIFVMALNLYPNFMMVSETIESLSSSPITGYIGGALLSVLLLIEAKNFVYWLERKFKPTCCDTDNPYLRFFLRGKNNLFSLVNTAIFLADYYFAMSEESTKTLWFFMPFVALRYFAFFDMFSEDRDNQVISSFARRNKFTPSKSDKNKQLREFIRRTRPLLRNHFTAPVISRLTDAVFKTG